MKIKLFVLIISLLFIASCGLQYVKDADTPFERPFYSFSPPTGDEWFYSEWAQSGKYTLGFGKNYDSKTHTVRAMVSEIRANDIFENQKEFLAFTKKALELTIDPRRFDVIEHKVKIDNKFGDYCIQYSSISKDYGAANIGDYRFLTMKIHGYYFIHPYFSDLIIDISYSERGIETEINSNFTEEAIKFADGIKLKKY